MRSRIVDNGEGVAAEDESLYLWKFGKGKVVQVFYLVHVKGEGFEKRSFDAGKASEFAVVECHILQEREFAR